MKLSSYGFSLMELMIGGAILAGIGLTGAQLIKGQKTTQTRIDHDLELDLIHARISDMFTENAKDCDATFTHLRGTALTTPITAIRKCSVGCERHLDASSVPPGAPIAFATGIGAPELSPRGLWYIESFGALRPHNDVSNVGTNLMVMPVNYAHKRQTNRRVTKFVTIAMRFNSSGGFVQCLDANSSNIHNITKEVCNTLVGISSAGVMIRGIWNGETNRCNTTGINTLCNPADRVAYDGIPGTFRVGNGCIPVDRVMTTPIKNHPWLPHPFVDNTLPDCRVHNHQALRVRLSKASGNRLTFVCQ